MTWYLLGTTLVLQICIDMSVFIIDAQNIHEVILAIILLAITSRYLPIPKFGTEYYEFIS